VKPTSESGPAIDLNADIGEAADEPGLAVEAALAGIVTSVNIACGGHAGDAESMRRAVEWALAHGCAIGAHPSYPDRAGFGRTPLDVSPEDLTALLIDQIGELARIAEASGTCLSHVKPHGALYHDASEAESVAEAVLAAARAVDPGVLLFGAAGSPAVGWWSGRGGDCVHEAFADRVYEPDGRLRSRDLPGALVGSARAAAAQARSIAAERHVVAADGTRIGIAAGSICLHADTPGALAMAEAVANELRAAGIALRAPSRGPSGR
tara:strand:+ start:4183 stop:4980 length:798 start_codon:yes stop_codon:yes gene_type:complete